MGKPGGDNFLQQLNVAGKTLRREEKYCTFLCFEPLRLPGNHSSQLSCKKNLTVIINLSAFDICPMAETAF